METPQSFEYPQLPKFRVFLLMKDVREKYGIGDGTRPSVFTKWRGKLSRRVGTPTSDLATLEPATRLQWKRHRHTIANSFPRSTSLAQEGFEEEVWVRGGTRPSNNSSVTTCHGKMSL